MTVSSCLKILIADDTDVDRKILESIVSKDGHQTVLAQDGLEAVEVFLEEKPDIVLLDVLMPGLDGFEAARRIKSVAGEELVPVIFLTSLTDAESLVRCLEAGGDDFLSKPYNRTILQAKIKAFSRMRELHTTMLVQRDQIAKHNDHLIQEQNVAKQVFDNITHSGCLDASNIKYLLSPMAVFNGDVLVATLRPSGSMMVLLGDFTGHGLPAAIGAMPLASTFYSMAQKGYGMADILREINHKLKSILPIGVFCCAICLEFDFRDHTVKAWNGGLPDCIIYRGKNRDVEPIKSRHLPLGVLGNAEFKYKSSHYSLEEGDRCYLWSDGIHEARNSKGDMYGEERLLDVFSNNQNKETIFDELLNSVHKFTDGTEADDDLSLIEVTMANHSEIDTKALDQLAYSGPGLMDWALDFDIKPSTFRSFDPLPLLLNILTEVPGLRSHSGSLYTLLAELYSNALEHGVLGLDSALKQSPKGFSDYYDLRIQRMAEIDEGFVKIHLSHKPDPKGGRLTIRIMDSGEGFDYRDNIGNEHKTEGYSGRGIPLIRTMCESFQYNNTGNEVEAVYRWLDKDLP